MLTLRFSIHPGAWQLTQGSPRCKGRWWTHRTRLRDQRCQGPWHVMVTPVTKERLVMAGDFNGKNCRRSWITKSHKNATRHKGHKGLQIKTSDAGPPGRRCVGCTRRRRLGAMDGECALLEENNFQEPLMMKWVYGVYGQYPQPQFKS